MADSYVCTLDEKSLKKAKKELNEDPADRMNAVNAFRNLIQTRAPHLKCSMETTFLLRFLRVAKFSQLEALNRLEKYLELFNTMPDWLRDIDMMDPKIQAFLDTGFLVPLGYQCDGRRLNLYNMGALNPDSKKYDKKSIIRGMFGIVIYMSWDEATMVNGHNAFCDLTGMTFKHQTLFTLEDMKRSACLMNGSWPTRWKNIYHYNHGPIFEAMLNMGKVFLKKKKVPTVFMLGDNLESIYDQYIPKEMFPIDYLPDDYTGPHKGNMKDIVTNLKNELSKPEVVARIKYETGPDFRLDASKRPKDSAPVESFRKLSVD